MKLNEFDTTHLGFPVVEISDLSTLSKCASFYTHGLAHLIQENSLLKADHPVSSHSQINVLTGDLTSFCTKILKMPSLYKISLINSSNEVDSLHSIIESTIDNRFSNEPTIGKLKAVDHKIALIKGHFSKGMSVVAYAMKDSTILGFHQMNIADRKLRLYEVATDSSHRNGFLAISLIKAALQSHMDSGRLADLHQVETSIYSANTASLTFFQKLGLSVARSEHHFHFSF